MEDVTDLFDSLAVTSTNGTCGSVDLVAFVAKGNAGRTIFAECILPFLTLDDLIHAAHTCTSINHICKALTLGDILQTHSLGDGLSREIKTEMGKFVMVAFCSAYAYSATKVHRKLVRSPIDSFWARLYHPSAVDEILLLMAFFLRRNGLPFLSDTVEWPSESDHATNPKLPRLVNAKYGHNGQETDVTDVLKFFLLRQCKKTTRLVLKKPRHAPQYWYDCLFGDPVPRKTKTLHVTFSTREKGKNVSRTKVYVQDMNVVEDLLALVELNGK